MDKTNKKTAIIIGAGPAGLTAALELIRKTNIKPIIYEASGDIGGIAKTINYKGNRIDIGGHRFFSKSDIVMKWWQEILPIQGAPAKDDLILGRKIHLATDNGSPDPKITDKVLLIRNRLSRIFYIRRFFDYPISLNLSTFANLGPVSVTKIILSYFKARVFRIKNEASLEDFFINRFGKELYLTFFKDYTEKVWGVPCKRINPEWGAQRIKGLSITQLLIHAVKTTVRRDNSIDQKELETSLIGQFLYPKLGPGQMWEEVARIISNNGGEINVDQRVVGIELVENQITEVLISKGQNGSINRVKADYVFSSMAVKDLFAAINGDVPAEARAVASGLMYRDFITVGVLLKKLKIKNQTKTMTINEIIPDNWLYIQDRDVKLGRVQIFNNWSPYMVKDENTVWLGLEYFCNEGDDLWNKSDPEFANFALGELAKIGFIEEDDVLDHVVIRMPKCYPAYFGSYEQFDLLRKFTDKIENLFLVGRNGMHRYNNQDHSMLTAIQSVDNIVNNVKEKENIWAVNAEPTYHEKREN